MAPQEKANTSLLADQQMAQLQSLAAGLSPTQQAWVSGYMAAMSQFSAHAVTSTPATSGASLTVLIGSQTGNARAVADELQAQAGRQPGHPRVAGQHGRVQAPAAQAGVSRGHPGQHPR